ncbi:HU family DNA-binding protein [Moraxella sp. ZJ142]|uniref:HU family DNA-binding protein n=1 Tax=Moraxella marmotae TaxID=3344520 RepID=UPI0035D3DBAB
MQMVLNKSDLITNLASRCDNIDEYIVTESVRLIVAMMVDELVHDGRIEVRGFGSFCLHHRDARLARNPRTGEKVSVKAKAVPYFKPGKALRESVNVIAD